MSAVPPFSPRRVRVAASFPHKGGSTTPLSFLPPLRGKVSGVAHRAKPDGRGVPANASRAALPLLASVTLVPYQVIAFARPCFSPPGGGGMGDGWRREQLYCRSRRITLKTNGEAK